MLKEATQSWKFKANSPMAISPTSPASCWGTKGFLHCLVCCPHSPAKAGYLWDERTTFCASRLHSSLCSSGYAPHTCTHCLSLQIQEWRDFSLLWHWNWRPLPPQGSSACPPHQPPLAWAPLALPLLSPALFAELQDLQVPRCYWIPAQLSERSPSLISLPPDTFRFPRPLIFPGSLNQWSHSVNCSLPRMSL